VAERKPREDHDVEGRGQLGGVVHQSTRAGQRYSVCRSPNLAESAVLFLSSMVHPLLFVITNKLQGIHAQPCTATTTKLKARI
jgi:hypothetical protein